MDNIKAIIGSYADTSQKKLTMCAPIVVYLNTNYPKQHIGKQCSALGDYHKLSFAHKSYQPYGDNIFFQIFPLGSIDQTSEEDFNILKKYSTTKQNYIDYPSMMLTPTGTLMNAPIMFDALQPFLNNGIYGTGEGLSKNENIYGGNPSASSCMNWEAFVGNFNKVDEGFEPQAAALFTNKAPGETGYMSLSAKNFGHRKIVAAQKKNKPYSYVCGLQCDFLGKEYDPKKHKDSIYTSKRIYKLANYNLSNPLKEALNVVQKDNSYTYLVKDNTSKPFLFIINFSKGQNIYANLDFGYNRIQFHTNDRALYLNVSDISWFSDSNGVINTTVQARKNNCRRAQCSYKQDSNTRLPYFYYGDDGFKGKGDDARNMACVVYPAYCGIAIQPGLHFPNNVQSSKDSPVQRGIGSVVELIVSNKRRSPTLQVWLQEAKKQYSGNSSNSNSYNGNVFLQPHKAHWSSDLRLTINNGTANFFYMPLYFVSKCRFRMYFKGIKGGKYTTQGLPDGSDKPYKTSAQAKSTTCTITTTSKGAIEYANHTTIDEDGGAKQEYNKFASHIYYGNLIYTTAQGWQPTTGSDTLKTLSAINTPPASYITTPVTSYHMPPVTDSTTDKSFWDKYSMDSYYFDFVINMDDGQNEGALPFIRQTIQVQAVLIMQVTEYTKSLLDNSNGEFVLEKSKLYHKNATDAQQLTITKSTTKSTKLNWTQYIQNISVSWNQEGGSGSITVDKYALMGQEALPAQCIGGLSISMTGGNPNIINTSSSSAGNRSSCIFTGYATKISTSDSFGSDTINITLQGPQRKLNDLKLINPPFWDGDKLKTAYDWLSHYCGIAVVYDTNYFSEKTSYDQAADNAINYVDENGKVQKRTKSDFPRLPTSSNFKRPQVYIKTGQEAFKVFQDLATKCNCRFVLQPDGKAYVMTQTEMAVPQMCDSLDASSGRKFAGAGYYAPFNPELILSYSVQPLLNNLHNYVITAAFKSANIGAVEGESTGSIEAGFKVNKKFRKLNTTPNIPWSKVKAFKHQGFMSQARVQEQFKRDMYIVSSYWLNVKLTIPGNQMIWIYDKLTLFGTNYYVTQISHNIDLITKKWTTDLSLSNVYEQLSE